MNPIEPLTARQLNRAIHDAGIAAGIDKRVSMHTLRHYAAPETMPGWPRSSCFQRFAGQLTRHSFMSSFHR